MKKFHNSYIETNMITATAEARVVELSLQYPDSHLVRIFRILKKEDIDISFPSIFHILKRHGLENREKR